MGFANLVPGISGGTMILAVGLYDRFVGTIAAFTRLRPGREELRFVALFGLGAVLAVASLSGLLVDLVSTHRWLMYSLFVGMTLGGVPELWAQVRPLSAAVVLWVLAGVGVMVALAFGLESIQVPTTPLALVGVGAVAASSMILPGVSGSYLLLLFGLYETVIGSLSRDELLGNTAASLAILAPVGVGAALGIGLLSNGLKRLLERSPRATHGALMGLLLGSVLGLWPFQEPVHPDLARRPVRKAVERALMEPEADLAALGAELELVEAASLEALVEAHRGASRADLKQRAEQLRRFEPTGAQIGTVLGVLVLGFAITRAVGRQPAR
jgi:putative membrane protein